MKKLGYLMIIVFTVLVFLPVLSEGAQTKAKASLPQVPITYPGDTDKAIMRRAQWIEGAKKEGKIVLWANIDPKEAKKVADQFNKSYPFITVEISRSVSEDKEGLLEAEFAAGKMSVDVMEGGGRVNTARWRKMGIIAKFTDIIPAIGKMPKSQYSEYGDWAMPGSNPIVPMYNTNLLTAAEAPKKWEDLLDPKWKGKLGMPNRLMYWAVLALGENGWGIPKTEDFLRKLKQQKIIWAGGPSKAHTLMVTGEYPILVTDSLWHCLQSQDSGAPVEWARVSPIPVTGPAFTMMSKAPHPNAARLFIEWQFSPVGLQVYGDVTQRGVVFRGAGTRQAKLVENLVLVNRTEKLEEKEEQMKLVDRFANILEVKEYQ
jgi:iron(III) transport system substrate-binding protein